MERRKLKIAIVGAGPSGLCSAKHSLDYGHDVTVYEQNSNVGGLWLYSDDIGETVHSSIYKGLLTNLPVDFMRFLGYPFPRTQRSFVSHEIILAYIQSYAITFDLCRVIRFQNQVVNVRPLQEDRWEVFSKDLKNNICETKQFDGIFICNGHYTAPFIPRFDGLDEFVGQKMHSHDYRRPNQFENETVLVIGSGPSGRDITFEITSKAKRVIWSNHSKFYDFSLPSKFPSNLKKVEDVKRFTANSVQLMNGDEEEISCVLFCTGYKYSFPFLSVDCGLNLKDRLHVEPLYKEVININHPTMAIIGLSPCILTYLRHDLQALLCLKYWNGEIELPTREEMLFELRIENEKRMDIGFDSRKCYLLIENMIDYLNELCGICKMNIVPKVFHKLADDLFELITTNPSTFREYNYTILNDETFERKHISE